MASSDWARARSISDSLCWRASSARFCASKALASSRSLPRTPVSDRMVTTWVCTSRMPPETKITSSSSWNGTLMRTEPGLMRVRRGAWRGAMPSSPASPGTTTISAWPENRFCSALTTSTCIVIAMMALLLDGFGLLDRLFNGANHVECLLGQMVKVAVDDAFEARERVLQRHKFAGRAGKHLGDEERLRQEALDLARPRHGQLVFRGELVHAQNGDNVAQLLVALQGGLHRARDLVVLL